MPDENKFVTRTEWIDKNGKIYQRFNENEIKYNQKFSELNSKIEKQTDIAERSLESQERQERFQEKLSDTMSKFVDDFVNIKYKVNSHDEKLKSVQSTLDEKIKANVQMNGYIISGVVAIICAAFGFAKVFF